MKCPYCAEEIQDEAVVCRYCEHDLWLAKPLVHRLAAVESELGRVREHLDALPSGLTTGRLVPLLVIAICILFTTGFFMVLFPSPILAKTSFVFFAVLGPPTVLGCGLGLLWQRGSLGGLLLAGLSIGFVNFLATLSFDMDKYNWGLALIHFLITEPLVFASAGLFGRTLLRSLWAPRPGQSLPPVSVLETWLEWLVRGNKRAEAVVTFVGHVVTQVAAIYSLGRFLPS